MGVTGCVFHLDTDSEIHYDSDRFNEICCDFYRGLYDVIKLLGPQHHLVLMKEMAACHLKTILLEQFFPLRLCHKIYAGLQMANPRRK